MDWNKASPDFVLSDSGILGQGKFSVGHWLSNGAKLAIGITVPFIVLCMISSKRPRRSNHSNPYSMVHPTGDYPIDLNESGDFSLGLKASTNLSDLDASAGYDISSSGGFHVDINSSAELKGRN